MDVLALDFRILIGRGWTPVGRVRDRTENNEARDAGGQETDR